MFEHVVERQQPPQHDLRRGGPAMPDVLGPEHPIDSPRRDSAEPEPGAVPRLLDRMLTAPPNEAVGERRIGPADEGKVLGAEEHAAVQATSVPQSQAQASASCGRARSGGEWVVKRSSRGRRSKMLSCSTCSIWLRLQRSRRTNLR